MIDNVWTLLVPAALSLTSGGLVFFLRDRLWQHTHQPIEDSENSTPWSRLRQNIHHRWSTMGLRMDLTLVLSGFLMIAVIIGFAVQSLFPGQYLTAIGASTGVLLLTSLLVANGLSYQQNRFEQNLHESLELMVASLSVGVPMIECLRTVVRGSKGPMKRELALALHRLEGGLNTDAAFRTLKIRYPGEGVRAFITAIDSSWRTGGDPASLMRSVVELMKRRIALREEVHAGLSSLVSAALFIGVLPYGLIFIFLWKDPEWLSILVDHHYGPSLMVLAVITQLVGLIWLKFLARSATP